jgi:hypothetical protein
MSQKKCPICSMMSEVQNHREFFAKWVTCDFCGSYIIEKNLYNTLSLKTKSCIYYYLTENFTRYQEEQVIPHFHKNDNWKDGRVEKKDIISEKTLLKRYPKTQEQKTDMILLNIAYRLKFQSDVFTTYFSIEDAAIYPLFFIDDSYSRDSLSTQLNVTLENLERQRYVMHELSLGDNGRIYTLTATGWLRVDELRQKAKKAN